MSRVRKETMCKENIGSSTNNGRPIPKDKEVRKLQSVFGNNPSFTALSDDEIAELSIYNQNAIISESDDMDFYYMLEIIGHFSLDNLCYSIIRPCRCVVEFDKNRTIVTTGLFKTLNSISRLLTRLMNDEITQVNVWKVAEEKSVLKTFDTGEKVLEFFNCKRGNVQRDESKIGTRMQRETMCVENIGSTINNGPIIPANKKTRRLYNVLNANGSHTALSDSEIEILSKYNLNACVTNDGDDVEFYYQIIFEGQFSFENRCYSIIKPCRCVVESSDQGFTITTAKFVKKNSISKLISRLEKDVFYNAKLLKVLLDGSTSLVGEFASVFELRKFLTGSEKDKQIHVYKSAYADVVKRNEQESDFSIIEDDINKIVQKKGHISEDDFLDLCIDYDLSLVEIERLSDKYIHIMSAPKPSKNMQYEENIYYEKFSNSVYKKYGEKKAEEILTVLLKLQDFIKKDGQTPDITFFTEIDGHTVFKLKNLSHSLEYNSNFQKEFYRERAIVKTAISAYISFAKYYEKRSIRDERHSINSTVGHHEKVEKRARTFVDISRPTGKKTKEDFLSYLIDEGYKTSTAHGYLSAADKAEKFLNSTYIYVKSFYEIEDAEQAERLARMVKEHPDYHPVDSSMITALMRYCDYLKKFE